MPEFTQEQIDAMIAEKIAEAKKGLLSEDEVQRKVTAEVDRRVESGIQKGLETQRRKWEEDFSARAKLTAEELAKKDFEDKIREVSTKELEIRKKANRIEAMEMLSDAQIPKSQYNNFLSVLVTDDDAQTKTNVENFIAMFNTTKTEIETKVKSELTKIPPPKQEGGDHPTSKDDFDKMTFAQKIAFKQKYPEIYKQFIK